MRIPGRIIPSLPRSGSRPSVGPDFRLDHYFVCIQPAQASIVSGMAAAPIKEALAFGVESEKKQDLRSPERADRFVAADQLVVANAAVGHPYGPDRLNPQAGAATQSPAENDGIERIPVEPGQAVDGTVIEGTGNRGDVIHPPGGILLQETPPGDFDGDVNLRCVFHAVIPLGSSQTTAGQVPGVFRMRAVAADVSCPSPLTALAALRTGTRRSVFLCGFVAAAGSVRPVPHKSATGLKTFRKFSVLQVCGPAGVPVRRDPLRMIRVERLARNRMTAARVYLDRRICSFEEGYRGSTPMDPCPGLCAPCRPFPYAFGHFRHGSAKLPFPKAPPIGFPNRIRAERPSPSGRDHGTVTRDSDQYSASGDLVRKGVSNKTPGRHSHLPRGHCAFLSVLAHVSSRKCPAGGRSALRLSPGYGTIGPVAYARWILPVSVESILDPPESAGTHPCRLQVVSCNRYHDRETVISMYPFAASHYNGRTSPTTAVANTMGQAAK